VSKVQRNDPCPCGSGKKFKHCGCGGDFEDSVEVVEKQSPLVPMILGSLVVAASVAIGISEQSVGSGLTILVAGALLLVGFVVLRKPPPSNPNSGDPSSLNFGR